MGDPVLWTKIYFNIMHLVNLRIKFCEKLQIHGSGDLLNLVLLLNSILEVQLHEILM